MTRNAKQELAKALAGAAADLAAASESAAARSVIAAWLRHLPGEAWDTRLGPKRPARNVAGQLVLALQEGTNR